LHIATYNKNGAMIFTLLAYGADPRIENYEHQTPVHLAAQTPYILTTFLIAMAKDGKEINALLDTKDKFEQRLKELAPKTEALCSGNDQK